MNLVLITDARVFVSPALVDDFEGLQADDSAEARLLHLVLTVPPMRIARVTERGFKKVGLRSYLLVPSCIAPRPAWLLLLGRSKRSIKEEATMRAVTASITPGSTRAGVTAAAIIAMKTAP